MRALTKTRVFDFEQLYYDGKTAHFQNEKKKDVFFLNNVNEEQWERLQFSFVNCKRYMDIVWLIEEVAQNKK